MEARRNPEMKNVAYLINVIFLALDSSCVLRIPESPDELYVTLYFLPPVSV